QRRQKLRPTLFPAAQLGQVMPVSYVSVGTGGFTVRTDGLCLTVTWSVGDRTSVPGSRGSGVAGVTAEVVDVGVWLVVGGVQPPPCVEVWVVGVGGVVVTGGTVCCVVACWLAVCCVWVVAGGCQLGDVVRPPSVTGLG